MPTNLKTSVEKCTLISMNERNGRCLTEGCDYLDKTLPLEIDNKDILHNNV